MIEVEQCSKCGKLKIPDEIEERVKNGDEVEVDVNWSKIGTYASNTLLWETGGLNIDGCRIGIDLDNEPNLRPNAKNHDTIDGDSSMFKMGGVHQDDETGHHSKKGRWPANVVLDTSAAALLDRQSGISKSTKNVESDKRKNKGDSMFLDGVHRPENSFSDEGGASRFFKTVKRAKAFKNEDGERDFQSRMYYSAKAHKSERNAGLEDLEDREGLGQENKKDGSTSAVGNSNPVCKKCGKSRYDRGNGICNCDNPDWEKPKNKEVKNDIATLKPINLMRWLVRLITPKDGTVLDPFAGSGTTGCACEIEGFDYILIEKRERFANIIAPKRCEYWSKEKNWKELKEHTELPNPKNRKRKKLTDFLKGDSK